jgi:general secretion pathway protein M
MATLSLSAMRTLSERERRVLLFGTPIALVLFFLAVVLPLDRRVSRLHQQVARKQSDLVWMRQVAPELAAAGPVRASTTPLIVLVDQSARQAGLGHALSGSTPNGSKSLSVSLRQAPFDTLIGWLARLHQRYGVRVDSATISRADGPGEVNASLVLSMP